MRIVRHNIEVGGILVTLHLKRRQRNSRVPPLAPNVTVLY
jgi:hypothetical protein